MFKIIGDDIIYKNVKVATLSKLVPSFRDEVEEVLKNNFFSDDEINALQDQADAEREKFNRIVLNGGK